MCNIRRVSSASYSLTSALEFSHRVGDFADSDKYVSTITHRLREKQLTRRDYLKRLFCNVRDAQSRTLITFQKKKKQTSCRTESFDRNLHFPGREKETSLSLFLKNTFRKNSPDEFFTHNVPSNDVSAEKIDACAIAIRTYGFRCRKRSLVSQRGVSLSLSWSL